MGAAVGNAPSRSVGCRGHRIACGKNGANHRRAVGSDGRGQRSSLGGAAIPSQNELPCDGPLPNELELILANQLYIAKDQLTPGLQNRLVRVAAFQNPEFYPKLRYSCHQIRTYGRFEAEVFTTFQSLRRTGEGGEGGSGRDGLRAPFERRPARSRSANGWCGAAGRWALLRTAPRRRF